MTVRQRLEAMSDLAELTKRLQTMPRHSELTDTQP